MEPATKFAQKNHFTPGVKIAVDFNTVVGTGAQKIAYKGTYVGGKRDGQSCVVKRYKKDSAYAFSNAFDEEMKTIEQTQKIVEAWGKHTTTKSLKIVQNWPEVLPLQDGSNKSVMVEPKIAVFIKLNSNSGWACKDEGKLGDVAQAFSHFSYHITNGRLLVCDIQGGRKGSDTFVLSDPAIISSDGRSFGPTDLGRQGLHDWFARHSCNAYCKKDWLKPGKSNAKDYKKYFEKRVGTTYGQPKGAPYGASPFGANPFGASPFGASPYEKNTTYGDSSFPGAGSPFGGSGSPFGDSGSPFGAGFPFGESGSPFGAGFPFGGSGSPFGSPFGMPEFPLGSPRAPAGSPRPPMGSPRPPKLQIRSPRPPTGSPRPRGPYGGDSFGF